MSALLGTNELRLVLPGGQHTERVPHALLQLAFTALPDGAEELRGTLKAWTNGTGDLSTESLAKVEQQLLEIAHAHKDESGLLNKIALRSVGQIVDPGNLPEDWSQVHAVTVLALALRRLHLLSHCMGASVDTVDLDEPHG